MVGMEHGRFDGEVDGTSLDFTGREEASLRVEERRARFRQPYLACVTLTGEAINCITGSLKDIATDSCFVFFGGEEQKKIATGSQVGVSISVMRGKSSMAIGCSGTIIRVAKDGVAIRFDESLCWWPMFSLFPVNDHFFHDVVRQTS